jgi:hypothetical protein
MPNFKQKKRMKIPNKIIESRFPKKRRGKEERHENRRAALRR